MRRLVSIALGVMVLASSQAVAEVRAITDRSGEYKMTRVLARHTAKSSHRLQVARHVTAVWRPIGRSGSMYSLNPEGDRLHDLWPTIAEPARQPNYPWVFWSRSNGTDYDLVHSRWTAEGWSDIAPLHPAIPGNDLDVAVTFDDTGRPYVVWWNDQAGVGRVFFSMFLQTRWLEPMLVSDEAVDSRRPTIALEGATILVSFSTPHGAEALSVRFYRPSTITDDINPLGLWNNDENNDETTSGGIGPLIPLWP